MNPSFPNLRTSLLAAVRWRVEKAADPIPVQGAARGGDRAALHQPAERRASRRHLRLRRLRAAALFEPDQVRKRPRLAELLGAAETRDRDRDRPQARLSAHRGALPALRLASGAYLDRPATTDRQTLTLDTRGTQLPSAVTRPAHSPPPPPNA